MRWSVVVLGLLGGCYRPGADPACLTTCDPMLAAACPGSLVCMNDGKCHASDGSCGVETDGSVDGETTNYCYGVGALHFCLPARPSTPVLESNRRIDTAQCSGNLVGQVDGTDLCVISGETVELVNIDAIGSRPLVVISDSTITLSGYINATSKRTSPELPGPGSNPAVCSTISALVPGAGGNGGSFGGLGGNGGNMMTDPSDVVPPMVLRGGCPGGDGVGSGSAPGGRGGGAIYFIARTSITVNAIVNASGAGGSAATTNGGGGGGSGGMIGFDAPLITVAGRVFANGGGGAGGGAFVQTGFGGEPATNLIAATGGTGGTTGGSGGNGSLGGAGDGGGLGSTHGGGGGGGTGVIWVYPASQQAAFNTLVSPSPSN